MREALTASDRSFIANWCHEIGLQLGTSTLSAPLRVEVLGDEIIVILPATSYGITYFKPPNSPQLLVKDFLSKNDSSAPVTHAEFIARAWTAANVKARELGWIV